MLKVFTREVNKQLELEKQEYPDDDKRGNIYFEQEKDIDQNFKNELKSFNEMINQEYKSKESVNYF